MVVSRYTGFFERLAELGGPGAREEAVPVARSTLRALSTAVPVADREIVRPLLPSVLTDDFQQPYAGPSLTRDDLVAKVAAASGLARGQALEQLEVVCTVLSERMQPDERARLMRHLPRDLAALLEPAPRAEPPRHDPRRPASSRPPEADHSLAGFRGHDRRLSEARPERAHSGSVVRWDGTRDDHSLGGHRGRGEGDPLSEARPGSRRPLSGDGD